MLSDLLDAENDSLYEWLQLSRKVIAIPTLLANSTYLWLILAVKLRCTSQQPTASNMYDNTKSLGHILYKQRYISLMSPQAV